MNTFTLRINRAMFMRVMMLAFVFVFSAVAAFAQTPVPITIDTNQIFTQTNSWITVFAPILAIGGGIAIALALLSFIIGQIVKAVQNASSKK